MEERQHEPPDPPCRATVRAAKAVIVLTSLWLLAAYVILPALWRHFEHHPALEDAPRTSVTAQGIPGDPLNVGLIGTEDGVVHAVLGSGWEPAGPVAVGSSRQRQRTSKDEYVGKKVQTSMKEDVNVQMIEIVGTDAVGVDHDE